MWVCARNVHSACMHAYQASAKIPFHFICSFHSFIILNDGWNYASIGHRSLAWHIKCRHLTKPNQAIAVNCINNDITTRTANGIRLQSPILNNAFRWFLLLRYLDLNLKILNEWSECNIHLFVLQNFCYLCCVFVFQLNCYLQYCKCSFNCRTVCEFKKCYRLSLEILKFVQLIKLQYTICFMRVHTDQIFYHFNILIRDSNLKFFLSIEINRFLW